MESKIMQIFYDNDCLPYKDKDRAVHYPIVGSAFQGASQTTELRFYVDQIGGAECTWVALAKLPNGKVGSQILEIAHDNELDEDYASLSLSSFYTQAKGDLYISLQGYNGGVELEYDDETEIYEIVGTPVIQATGSIKIAINYATQVNGTDEYNQITFQEMLAYIGGKLDKSSGRYIKVIPINLINTDSFYNDYVKLNDIIFDKSSRKFYRITQVDPEYEYIEITLNPTNLDVEDLSVSGDGIFENEVRVKKGATYLTFDENGNVSLQDYLDEKQDVIPVITISPTHSGTITPVAVLNTLAKFPSYLTYTYNNESFIYEHCGSDSTYYYFRKLFSESVRASSNYLIYGGDVYIRVNKSTGVYSQLATQYNFYSKAQSDALLDLKADKSDTYTKEEIDTKLTSMLVYKGTKTVAELNALAPTLSSVQTGWFYNVSDSGTLTAGSVEVLAGDNVAWTGSGWDKLTMDLTVYNETFLAAGFLQAGEIDSVPEDLTFDENGDITNPNWTGEIAIDYMSPPISDISISDVPATLTFDLTQDYDNMITNANWTGIMTITY